MPLPLDSLRAIEQSVDHVLRDGGLNSQQLTFVHHIQRMTVELFSAVVPIPQTETALRRIIPSFGDSFLQQQVALFGYARLLLESPESFGGAILSEYQQDEMQKIYQQGQSLYQLTEQLVKDAQDERRKQHQAPRFVFDVEVLLQDELPILQYYLRDMPVTLSLETESLMVHANAYHLGALIQHIVTTIAQELIEQGHIIIQTQPIQGDIRITIFCTTLRLDETKIETLFQKNGRYLYSQRWQKNGGTIRFLRESSRGAGVQLGLAKLKP